MPFLAFTLTLLLLLASPTSASTLDPIEEIGALPVSLQNPSFEIGFTGWIATANTASPAPGDELYPAPEGSRCAIPGSGSCGPGFSLDLVQRLPILQANSLYECQIDVYPLAGEQQSLYFRMLDASTDYQEFAAQIYRPPWNEEQETVELQPETWNTITLTFSSSDVPDYTGLPFYIQVQGCGIAVDNVRLYRLPLTVSPGDTSYYVSESLGDDDNDGLSPASPWQSFRNVRKRYFAPGDQVMLRREDTWQSPLVVRGQGSPGSPAKLSSYGEGDRPQIHLADKEQGRAITLHNASYWVVSGLAASEAKIGLYLRYFDSYGNTDVVIEDCLFSDMDSWTVDTAGTNFELSFNTGIFLGGRVGGGDDQFRTVLEGLTIRDCGFENCTAGFLVGWYFPELVYDRVKDVVIEDSYATRVSAGGVLLNSVEDAVIRRFRTYEPCGRNEDFIWGSTGGILSSSRNILIEDCEFSETDRMWHDDQAGDGCGFDIDGRNVNVTVRDTIFHDNDGVGLLFLSTYGVSNTGVLVEDCVMYNNGLNGAVSYGGNAWEIKVPEGTLSGIFRNLGLYRSDESWGWIENSQPWQFTAENIRYQWHTADAASRPAPSWDFNEPGDFGGWGSFNDWASPQVSDGALSGVSGGVDPFAISPEVWINTHRERAMILEMSVDAGTLAQAFFLRETDPLWDSEKSIAFEIIPDGMMHRYELDLRSIPAYRGVITRLRIDPTDKSGASMRIGDVNIVANTQYKRPVNPSELTALMSSPGVATLEWLDNATDEDHYVVERAEGTGEYAWLATLPADSTVYTDNTITPGESFSYRVRAFNPAGFSQPGAEARLPMSNGFLIY